MRFATRSTLLSVALLAGASALPAPAAAVCPNVSVPATAQNARQAAEAVVCAVNDVRNRFQLPLLRRDERLMAASAAHSQDMATRNYFEHDSPEGVTPSARAQQHGYPGGVAENIFAGPDTPAEVVEGWIESPGHCRNILAPGHADIGAGVGFGGRFGRYWTLKLGRQPGVPAPSSNRVPAEGCPRAVDVESGDFTGGSDPGGAGGETLPAARVTGVRITVGRRSLVVRGAIDPALAGQRVIVRAGGRGARRTARGTTRELGAFTVRVTRPAGRRIPVQIVVPASPGRFAAGRLTTSARA